jgi:uncharacterized protein (TIGR03905 family)
MELNYKTQGVCAKEIDFSIENGKVKNVSFKSGCSGNLQGIGKLVEGMQVEEVITKLRGLDCGGRGTSCPDQLSKALQKALEENK